MLYWLDYLTKIPSIYGENAIPNSKIFFKNVGDNDEDQQKNNYSYFTFSNDDGEFRKFLPKYGRFEVWQDENEDDRQEVVLYDGSHNLVEF